MLAQRRRRCMGNFKVTSIQSFVSAWSNTKIFEFTDGSIQAQIRFSDRLDQTVDVQIFHKLEILAWMKMECIRVI